MDSLLAATPTASQCKGSAELEATIPWTATTASSAEDDHWAIFEEKPESPAWSTPFAQEALSFVQGGTVKKLGAPLPPQALGLPLSDRFQPLEGIPASGYPQSSTVPPAVSQAGSTSSPDPVHPQHLSPHSGRSTRPSGVVVRRTGRLGQRSRHRRRVPRGRPLRTPSPYSGPPSVLIVGSSVVRDVVLPEAKTLCYPGARVLNINSTILSSLLEYPSASAVVVHVGSNDTSSEQSEQLKDDFKTLVDTLLTSGKQFVLSGPLPSPHDTDMKFSRIRQLHIWLKGYCSSKGIPFVDNFCAFNQRRNLFERDGVHLSRAGSRLLAMNIDLALLSGKPLDI